MAISINNTQLGSSNAYGSNSGSAGSHTGEWFPLVHSRQQVSLSLLAGDTVLWVLGAKGPGTGNIVVANATTGDSIIYVGPKGSYVGPAPDVRVDGDGGLGLLAGSYTGSAKTVSLLGSASDTCQTPNFEYVDSDDYTAVLLLQANGLI